MPVTVEKLADLPVVIAVLEGQVNVPVIQEMYRRSAELCEGIEGPIFRITDVREVTTSFAEMLGVIREASKGTPGSTTDPRFHPVFVGNNQWVRLVRDAMSQPQFGGINMPLFTSREDAMLYIIDQLGSDRNTANG